LPSGDYFSTFQKEKQRNIVELLKCLLAQLNLDISETEKFNEIIKKLEKKENIAYKVYI